jgi:hypothetical protein
MSRKPKEGWGDLVEGLEDAPSKPKSVPPQESAPPKKARSSAPPPAAAGIKLPKPPSGAPPKAQAMPPPASFSGDDLVEKLGMGGSKPAADQSSSWKEYRELIITAVVGVFALAAVLAYKAGGDGDEPDHEVVSPPAAAQPAPSPPPPTPPPVPAKVEPPAPVAERVEPPAQPQQPSKPERAAVPMVSILSTPPGAAVEINGLVRGKTPLIMPSPSVERSISVRVMLDGYKRWDQEIIANEAGHFVATVQLESIR